MNDTDASPVTSYFIHAVLNSYDYIYEADYTDNCIYTYDLTESGLLKTKSKITLSEYLSISENEECFQDDRTLYHNSFSYDAVNALTTSHKHISIKIRRRSTDSQTCKWWSLYGELSANERGHVVMIVCMRDIHEAEMEFPENTVILKSLSRMNAYTFIVNFRENTYRHILCNNQIDSSPKKQPFTDAVHHFAEHYVHPDDICAFLEHINGENILRTLQQTEHMEFEFREKVNDHMEWVRLYIVPVYNHTGDSVIIAGNIITAQKEEELMNREALKTAYIAANRATQEKSRFLKSMSHDMRTPINVILGMCTMASVYADNSRKVEECLDKISSASDHLLKLINNILDMSRIEEGNPAITPECFDLEKELKNLVNLIRPEMDRHKHTFITDISDLDHDIVNSDMMKIRQILINILSNAAKYTPDNGQIIFIVNRQPTGTANVYDYEFIIRDNGIGIAPENLEHIFEPFYRSDDVLKNSIEGTGLGLAIVQNLIKLMNGNVYVESEPGRGTRFTVSIPMLRPESTAAATMETPEKPAKIIDIIHSHNYTGKRILIAEDNNINAELVDEFLSGSGVSLEHAHTGQEAINMFHDNPKGYFDAILMDIQMPYVDGYEATRNIRINVKNGGETIPIIAMTANAFSSDVKAAKNAGMNEHISKPLDIRVLYDVLDRYISNPR